MLTLLAQVQGQPDFTKSYGAITRGDTSKPQIALIFSADIYKDGTMYVLNVLNKNHIEGSFFLTGNFYRNPGNRYFIQSAKNSGNYLGPHSNRHLLCCAWESRDSLLFSEREFKTDLKDNYATMYSLFGIKESEAQYFLPAYEWYNQTISKWTREMGLTLIDFTPGTLSNTDYTTPDMDNYRSSKAIWKSIIDYQKKHDSGLNGFILLIHPATAPERTDKFYYNLDKLIRHLKSDGYHFVRIDTLLKE